MTIEEVIKSLEQEYGPLEWQPGREPIDVLIGTILSQNTSDVNSRKVFESLLSTFGSWESAASAPVEHIAQAIKPGGLSRIKAVRIKQILNKIEDEQGSLSLDFLKAMNISEAKDYLMHLPGVGPKTASCVLLFGLGKPSLPVDTHVFRVTKRLGLIDSKVSIEKAHNLLQGQIPPSKVYQFHLHLIEHGRRICHARQPCCNECVLKNGCPSLLALQKVAKS
ncbi:MAG: endonuclease III [Dehalococcoidia bacterium]|nr:endonuclease III [Dehalococcoidia bacterium]